jgi:prepilin-type N-terminal cleavage/methylation domain-containing protein
MRKGVPTRADGGFTLIEVVMGISILLIVTMALGLSLQAGALAARELREEQMVLARAQTYVDRVIAQEYGHDYDPDPTAAQLMELLDDDSTPGDVTLLQLSRWPLADGGWRFAPAGFPVEGEWRVTVDRDLNDNGVEDGDLETGERVFRVSVFFDGRLIIRTNRAKEVSL